MSRHIITAFCLCLAASVSIAAVPSLVNFQTTLTDAGGAPIDGTVSVVFSIYNVSSAGTAIWTETQSVAVADGQASVLLGSVTSLNAALFVDDSVFLGVKVESDPELSPRLRLVSTPFAFRVATIDSASGGTITGNVSIGTGHTNTGLSGFVAGKSNSVDQNFSSILGGEGNVVESHPFHPVGGMWAVVSGGKDNRAGGPYTVVGGGQQNDALHEGAVVAGGEGNMASGPVSTVGGGTFNDATGYWSTIAGGDHSDASGSFSFVGGGMQNAANDTGSTVSGGVENRARGVYATVSGGKQDTSSGDYATVGGGRLNVAVDDGSSIAGGTQNRAAGYSSTVGGGELNETFGAWSCVPGGFQNIASGNSSFACGHRAWALAPGSFVWSDTTGTFSTTTPNTFVIRATGGVGIGTNAPDAPFHVQQGSAGAVTGNGNSSAVFERNSENWIHMLTPDGSQCGILFGIGTDALHGSIRFNVNDSAGYHFRAGTNDTRMILDSLGNLTVDGNVCAPNIACPSDGRFKRNIETIPDALDMVSHLRGVRYEWEREKFADREFPEGQQIGVIAQEVREVVPQAVIEQSDGYLAVDYARLVPLLIESIKEQQKQIDELKSRLDRQTP